MEKRNIVFQNKVLMKVTADQYNKDLREPLLEMGYFWSSTSKNVENDIDSGYNTLSTRYLCNNGIAGSALTPTIENYNPDLFLALAAMTEGELPIVGEYIIGKNGWIPSKPERVSSISNGYYHTESNNNYWPSGFYRKATVEELIKYLGNNVNKLKVKEVMEPQSKEVPKSLVLTPEAAKSIMDVACSEWRKKLAIKWGYHIALEEVIEVDSSFYDKMIAASDSRQKKVVMDAFGMDPYPELKRGDICVVWDDDSKDLSIISIYAGNGLFTKYVEEINSDLSSFSWDNFQKVGSIY